MSEYGPVGGWITQRQKKPCSSKFSPALHVSAARFSHDDARHSVKCFVFIALKLETSQLVYTLAILSPTISSLLRAFLELLSEPKTHLGHFKSEQSIFGSTLGDEPK